MEVINAGDELASCGVAIVAGGMVGSMIGLPWLGMISAATGPNCLGWW
ncbi:hypothetical protein [Gaetbulibacter jejuensis]